MLRTPLTNETNGECVHHGRAGEMHPGFWRLPDDPSKVVSVVTQWHVGAVASAVAQLLCQHSSDSVIVLWPPGAQRRQVCNAASEKRTCNNRKWCTMTGKVSARELGEAQVKSQRWHVWSSTGSSCERWGLRSASAPTSHFTASGNVRMGSKQALPLMKHNFEATGVRNVDWKLRLGFIFNHWKSLVLCFVMSNSCFFCNCNYFTDTFFCGRKENSSIFSHWLGSSCI